MRILVKQILLALLETCIMREGVIDVYCNSEVCDGMREVGKHHQGSLPNAPVIGKIFIPCEYSNE